jgi:hypothetical protein
MLLIISLSLAAFSGLTNPYINRLDIISVWLGRVISEDFAINTEEKLSKTVADQMRNGLRTGGSWIFSTLEILAPISGIIGIIIGFFYTWWGGILAFIITSIINLLIEKSKLYSNQVGYYILFYIKRLTIRYANYIKDGDIVRAEAILETRNELAEILSIYIDLPIKVPDEKTSKGCPYGDRYYLFDLFNNSTK